MATTFDWILPEADAAETMYSPFSNPETSIVFAFVVEAVRPLVSRIVMLEQSSTPLTVSCPPLMDTES